MFGINAVGKQEAGQKG